MQTMVMNQSSSTIVEPAVSPAGIKTILFHVQNDASLTERLDCALSIARTFGAHLHLLHVTPIEAFTVTDAFATFVNADIIAVLEDEAGKLRARVEKKLEVEDVSWDYEEVTGTLMTHLLQRASLADLLIVGREPHEWLSGRSPVGSLGDMLHEMRTPIFIPGEGQSQVDLFGPAIVAWNGSTEAANALRSAVPLLKLASQVNVISIEESVDRRFPPTDAPEYLSRHGIHADLVVRPAVDGNVLEELLDEAVISGAAYIVMGGYSHSRAGEFFFGGLTRSLLKSCEVGLFVNR